MGAFLVLAGLLVVIGNLQDGVPIFSLEMMPDSSATKGDPVPYFVSWAVGICCLGYGFLLLVDALPEGWSFRQILSR